MATQRSEYRETLLNKHRCSGSLHLQIPLLEDREMILMHPYLENDMRRQLPRPSDHRFETPGKVLCV